MQAHSQDFLLGGGVPPGYGRVMVMQFIINKGINVRIN